MIKPPPSAGGAYRWSPHYGLAVYKPRGKPHRGHERGVVAAVCVWCANTTRIEIHHAVHSTKSMPSRTSRTRLSSAMLAVARSVRWLPVSVTAGIGEADRRGQATRF
jgi:hypothetical protein